MKKVTIGDNCLISWDNLIMDTDFHTIRDFATGERCNPDQEIIIGNHVWMGCRCTILKGASVGEDAIIAANSTVTRSVNQNHCIIGNSNSILKESVTWNL